MSLKLTDQRAAEIVVLYLKHLWIERLTKEGAVALDKIKEEIQAAARQTDVPFEEFEAVYRMIASEALADFTENQTKDKG